VAAVERVARVKVVVARGAVATAMKEEVKEAGAGATAMNAVKEAAAPTRAQQSIQCHAQLESRLGLTAGGASGIDSETPSGTNTAGGASGIDSETPSGTNTAGGASGIDSETPAAEDHWTGYDPWAGYNSDQQHDPLWAAIMANY